MKKRIIFLGLFLMTALVSCEKDSIDSDGHDSVISDKYDYQFKNKEVKTITNFKAYINDNQISGDKEPEKPQGFRKFSFAKGGETQGDDWDIAFNATKIIINGGKAEGLADEPNRTGNAASYITEGVLEQIEGVDYSKLQTKVLTGSGSWYTYDMSTHIIHCVPGKVIVVRTHDNKYAKMRMISYYKNKDEGTYKPSRYYTFEYIYE